MKQLTYIRHGEIRWEDVAEPILADRSAALVRPFVVSRSDMDAVVLQNDMQKNFRWGRLLQRVDKSIGKTLGKDLFKGPFGLGQECIAQVVDVGPDVTGVEKGQLVIVPSQVACGRCPTCQSGLTSHCEQFGAFDLYGGLGKRADRGGMLCDLVMVPAASRMLIPLPEDLDPIVVGSAGGNLVDGWSRVAPYLRDRPGKSVLIIGGSARSTALYATAFAAKMDPEQLDFIDRSAESAAIASRLGANGIERDYRRHEGSYDLILCGSAGDDTIGHVMDWLKPGGVCTAIHSSLSKEVPIPMFKMFASNLTLTSGQPNLLAVMPAMLDYLRNKSINIKPVNTHLGEFEAADQHFMKRTTKVIVHRSPI